MSELLDIAHDMATDLVDIGAMNKVTKRQIDALCLPPARDFKSVEIRKIRIRNKVSQSVFASILGVGKTTIQHWEQGVKTPSGPSRRLLDVVDRKGLVALV